MPDIVTIQKTGKAIKATMVIGFFCLIAGMFIFDEKSNANAFFGAFFFTLGVVLLIVAKISRWWNHS